MGEKFGVKHLYICSGILFLLAAWFSIGFRHGDEHYQIFEFANYYLGKRSSEHMPWEFYAMMRPSLQPIITAAGIIFFEFIGIADPFFMVFLFKSLNAVLLFFAIRLFLKSLALHENKLAVFLNYFLSGIPYIAARYSSESLSTSFFLILLASLIHAKQTKHFITAGIWAGLAFAFRYQIAFALAGTGIWLLLSEKNKWQNILSYILGFIFIVLISTLADYFFYGKWVLPPVEYFYQNIVLDRASGFGTDPWYYYFLKFLELTLYLPGAFVLVSIFWFTINYPKNILTISGWLFVLGHIMVAHKETRFLYPIIPLLPIVLFYFYQDFNHKIVHYLLILTIFVNILVLIPSIFLPASGEIFIMKYLEKDYPHQKFRLFYFEQNNPYEDYGCPNTFYARKNVIAVDQNKFNPKELEKDSLPNLWLSTKCNLEGTKIADYTLVRKMQMCPDFIIKNFNFNDWIDRTGILTVYELKKEKQ